MATATAALHRIRGSSLIDAIGLALLALVIVWVVFKFAQDPTRFLNVSILGARNGAIYGLVALGYTLVYGILQLINFAHGDVFALSGLVASTMILSVFSLDENAGVALIIIGLLGTLAVTIPLFAVFNGSIERIAYKPLRRAPRLAALITAVGVSFIVQNVSLAIYGVDFESASDLLSKDPAFTLGGISYDWNKVIVLFIVVPLLIG